MRVLVIGGSGFVGSHVVDALVKEGIDVVVFDRNMESYRATLPRVHYVKGELGNRGELEAVIANGIDHVIHLVSSTVPKTSNDDPIFDVQMNLVESLALFDLCVKHRVQKVIFTSSGGTVYGIPHVLPISEDHPTNPICSYGIVKLAIEKYLQFYKHSYNLDYVILRLSNPYGIRQDPRGIQGAVSVFMGNMLLGNPITLWGDGSIVRDFVNVRDVARLYYAAVTSKLNGIFNGGSGLGVSLLELLEIMSHQLKITPKVIHEPAREFDVPTIVLNCEKAAKKLLWVPKISLQEGLFEFAEWLKTTTGVSPSKMSRSSLLQIKGK